ncbi:MAG: MBL fold metallo-hydrolase [Calditrichaeota bacterium]|nr:MBL fold metallo-hydrolase [Calditrichota bacterium]
MIIERFLFIDSEEVNSYLMVCEDTRQALLIDAGGFDERLKQVVKTFDYKVNYLFITHAHYDHTEAVDQVFGLFPEIKLISAEYTYGNNIMKPTDGEKFTLGSLIGKFHHIPGHTDDMTVLYLDGHLFTGDALFAGSVGGTANDDNYKQQIKGIKEKLLTYPDDTIIHPGHGPDSTIGLEKSFNPFLQFSL